MTLPKIKWGLLYGVIMCNARAMGEFGAVSVVSGHIRGHDQHDAAARRNSVQRIPVRGRVCGGVAADVARAGDLDRQTAIGGRTPRELPGTPSEPEPITAGREAA